MVRKKVRRFGSEQQLCRKHWSLVPPLGRNSLGSHRQFFGSFFSRAIFSAEYCYRRCGFNFRAHSHANPSNFGQRSQQQRYFTVSDRTHLRNKGRGAHRDLPMALYLWSTAGSGNLFMGLASGSGDLGLGSRRRCSYDRTSGGALSLRLFNTLSSHHGHGGTDRGHHSLLRTASHGWCGIPLSHRHRGDPFYSLWCDLNILCSHRLRAVFFY